MSGVTVESATLSSDLYDFITNILTSPLILILVGLVLVSLTLKKGAGEEGSPTSTSILEIILFGVFLFLILINGLMYFFGVDITTTLSDFFTNNPKIDVNITELGDGLGDLGVREEVFHIPGNHYVYPDAKALCKAHGARLATYDEVEKSYRDGGEWCSYGWSEGQMALFPTQKSTWNALQEKEGHEHDCGRPGVNGGFIDNPAVRFGANCYGVKPQMTETEAELMKQQSEADIPVETREDKAIDKRSDYYKERLNSILVSPFNSSTWNEYRKL
jgi:hypothetical protein